MTDSIAVIDFETASSSSNSACQLGVVLLDNWKTTGEYEWLIRPQRMYFSPQCVRVHGITPRDVLNSPQWDKVWDELQPLIDGRTIIAHNVGFDAAVLLGTCRAYDIALPKTDLQCTRLIAKRTWPGQSGYGLAAISERLGIQFKHHNALEDSRACAKIAIAAAEIKTCDSLVDLEQTLGLDRGCIWLDQIRQPRTVRRTRTETIHEPQPRYQAKLFRSDGTPTRQETLRQNRVRVDAILEACGDAKPLAGKRVVLFNSLLGLQRDDAVRFLTQLGAVVQNAINMQTNYVILGPSPCTTPNEPSIPKSIDPASPPNDRDEASGSSPDMNMEHRLEQISKRQKDGQPIKILTQRQLLAVVPAGLAIARGEF